MQKLIALFIAKKSCYGEDGFSGKSAKAGMLKS